MKFPFQMENTSRSLLDYGGNSLGIDEGDSKPAGEGSFNGHDYCQFGSNFVGFCLCENCEWHAL
jgi:hypothetical protein